MIYEFLPIARAVIGLLDLKIISFRPLNFMACNAPIYQLYQLGIEIEENSELELFEAFHNHAGDGRIAAVAADMARELGEGNQKPEILEKLTQYELTLLDWVEAHKDSKKYAAIAGKEWTAFQTQFGFVPCYVNSRLIGRGIPISCEVDIYGALSKYIGVCVSENVVTLLESTILSCGICLNRIFSANLIIHTAIPLWAFIVAILARLSWRRVP